MGKVLIPHVELSPAETFDAGMSLLAQANALLEVHGVGSQGYLNLHEHNEVTAAEYFNAVQTLVSTAVGLLTHSTSEQVDRDQAIELMQQLFARFYIVDEYLNPTAEGKKTRKEAIEALDGFTDIAEDIQEALGIGGIAVFAENPSKTSAETKAEILKGGRDG